MSIQAEEERQSLDHEEKRGERMYEHHGVHTFPQEAQIGHEEENEEALPEKNAVKTEWRHSAAASQPGKRGQDEGETEDVPMEEADSRLEELATDGMVMSGQTGPEETREELLSGSHVSSDNSSTYASGDPYSPPTITAKEFPSFDIGNDKTSNPGSTEHVSTTVIPIITLCPDSDPKSCGVPITSTGHGVTSAPIRAESFPPNNVGAPPGASTLGSPLEPKVNMSPFGNRPEILAGTHSVTKDFEMDPPGFSDVSKSAKSRLESDESDPLLWSEQVRSVKKSVDSKPDGMQGHPNGKGAL
ncbi:uncharacterized protein LOC116690606 isoform X1 [Etheostoma spectabile]|uniref:uncharacterized protein LOC116690606 isoform X1 n=1 Tax=Etheostoma spectabile TaxID=54343 RepID=UPI0013AFDA9C|nr:uncharacterized protein LOC116690606 isoform X1 [Etheostoma spectabile]